jgi:iron complex outermembrane receptor protein
MRRFKTITKYTTAIALGAVPLSMAASAQESDEPAESVSEQESAEAEQQDAEHRLDRIQVTGSLLYRDEYTSTSPIEIITSDDALRKGLTSAADMIQSSTLGLSAPQLNETFLSTEAAGGLGTRTIDLRGCGDSRTLVLINGKRPGETGYSSGVPSFNLNDLPASIIERVEILKDSGSTIYGSDAICGVVNVITRTSVSGPEFNLSITQPFESGGEELSASAAYGFELNANAKFTFAAEYKRNRELNARDRDYHDCNEDYVFDPDTGERADRLNYSATASDPYDYCHNMSFYSITDLVTGQQFIPTQDGSTIPSPFGVVVPGFEPLSLTPQFSADGSPIYRNVEDAPFLGSRDIRPSSELLSIYGTSDVTFGDALNWKVQALYTRGEHESDGWRFFLPTVGSTLSPGGGVGGGIGGGIGGPGGGNLIGYPTDPDYANSLGRPVTAQIPIPTLYERTSDFYFVSSSLSGGYGDLVPGWSWNFDVIYSGRDTTDKSLRVLAAKSGDVAENGRDLDGDGVPDFVDPPTLDYLSRDILSGNAADELMAEIGATSILDGSYDQITFNAVTSGEVIDLPAGPVQLALGAEYREHELALTPDAIALAGGYHLAEAANIVRATNKIAEVFAEIEVPLLKAQPLAEDVFFNASIRAFDYEFGGSDHIYKLGLNWQITPTLRARTSHGTAYAAPTLLDQVREESSTFAPQFLVDPCVNWGLETNENVRENCAAEGAPETYSGGGNNIEQVYTVEPLDPERATSYSIGFVYTPTWADLSIALDYYDIEIEDEISELTLTQVFNGCYQASSYPNDFCEFFVREAADSPIAFAIQSVETPKINLNSQIQRGLDLSINYRKQLNYGDLDFRTTVSRPLERYRNIFGDEFEEGVPDLDRNGLIGYPELTASSTLSFSRLDWTYSWFTEYIGRQDDAALFEADPNEPAQYFGNLVLRKYHTEAQFTHGVSIGWQGDTWSFTGGVRNLCDEAPPRVSERGVVTFGAYDSVGRRVFATVSKRF